MRNHGQNSFGGFKVKSRYLSIIHTLFTCEYNIGINRAHIIKISLKIECRLRYSVVDQELAELPKVNGRTNDRLLVMFWPIESLWLRFLKP